MAHGKSGSALGVWASVALVLASFILGGLGLATGPFWLFWLALGLFAAGAALGWASDIMSVVEESEVSEPLPARTAP